jgi:hypothetical protein
MSEALLSAIADTLLPGDATVPAASKAGIDLASHAQSAAPIAAAAARLAGGEQDFIAGDEAKRIALLQSVQQELPDAFTALLAALLPDYYEAPTVIEALAWPSRPPQPQGHFLADMDAATIGRLEKVRLRRKIWRDEA